jgi:tRNA pseudouridine38-40 synthase
VRFGYDGVGLSGWARQPGRRTVEALIRDGLRRYEVAPDLAAARLAVASRTDRGVSARANALALSSELGAVELLRRLNAISPRLFFTAAASVVDGFPLRRPAARVYRYFEPFEERDLSRWVAAAGRFRGRVDVRSFGRGVPPSGPTWRDVESVGVRRRPGGVVIEVRAPAFVWGMVRKIVGAIREVDRGRLSLPRLEAAIAGRERLTVPLAEPERLVLWDVQYPGVRWTARWSGPNRHQAAESLRLRTELWARATVADALRRSWAGRRAEPGSGSARGGGLDPGAAGGPV